MPRLTGSAQQIALGQGYTVRAPGIQGDAELLQPHTDASRAGLAVDEGTAALDAALAATDVNEVRQIEVRLQRAAGPAPLQPLRSDAGQNLLELEVPDLGPETGHIVLAADEDGVLTWHLPEGGDASAEGTVRGGGMTKRFLIPATAIAAPPTRLGSEGAVSQQRGLVGTIGRKLLKVLIYPITDPILGPITSAFAEKWESRNRPYGLRTMSPANFRTKGAGAITAVDWTRMSSGRVLLFVHGTFSTAHDAFDGMADATFTELYKRYSGRVLAVNHFTLSHGPQQNVDWLLSQVPAGTKLEVDIICHSRGGLVARTLAERPSVFGLQTTPVEVKRVVFVAVPNHGTLLADADHMAKMLDRFTTALNLFPSGAIVETLESVITAVKILGHGGLKGLAGLASMHPTGEFLKSLNTNRPASVEYFAMAADYEPTTQGLRALVSGSVDAMVDMVFQNASNDLVVPEAGVYGDNGSGAFPIPDSHVLRLPPAEGIVHTTMFTHAGVNARLLDWLTPL